MKPRISVFNSAALSGAAVVFACLTGINPWPQAADQLWIGSAGDHNVTTPSNWVGGAPSVDSWSPFVFGSDVVDGTMYLERWVAIGGITLNSGLTQDITINASPIAMGGGIVDMSAAGVDLTINAPYGSAWGDVNLNVGAGRTLTLNGTFGEAPGWWGVPGGFIKNGAGMAVLTAAGTYTLATTINAGTLQLGDGTSGHDGSLPTRDVANNAALVYNLYGDQTAGYAISGTGTLTKLGTGTLNLTNALALNYTGGTTVNGGTLQVPAEWVNTSSPITVNTGAILLNSASGIFRIMYDLTLNGGTVNALGTPRAEGDWPNLLLWGGGQIAAGGATVSTINSVVGLGNTNTISVGTGSTLNINGAIRNHPWGVGYEGSLIKTGDGTLVLSGNNTYTGPTIVNGGTLQYGSAASAGNTSKITVNNGGSLYIDWWAGGGTINTPIELHGWGDGHGALWSYVEGSQFTFSGPVTLLGSSQIQGFAGNSTLNFTHAIGGTGSLTFYANGASPNHKDFMVLSGASTFSGDLYIESYAACSQVTLSGGENRLPTNTVVHIAAGKWAQDASNPDLMTSSALDLNGNNQTLAGLSDSGVSSLLGARSVVNTSGTMATLTLNTSANQLFSGAIGGTNINDMAGNNLALVKSGIATQTLSGVNSYIGSTAVSNGTLVVQQKCLSANADVHIASASGARLELGFEDTCTIRRLYVDGVLQQRNKVYSSANRPQALAGTGALYVGAEGAAPHGTLIRIH